MTLGQRCCASEYGSLDIAFPDYSDKTSDFGPVIYIEDARPYSGVTSRDREQDFTLDQMGNWSNLEDKTSGTTTLDQDRTHNAVNEIATTTETVGVNWGNPGHDAAGNLIAFARPLDPEGKAFTATYDAWNRMIALEHDGDDILANEYDGNHHRIAKDVIGDQEEPLEYYYNDRWQMIASTKKATIDSLYAWHLYYIDALAVRMRGPDKYLFLHDANFNVTAAYDVLSTSGTYRTVTERYRYTPYGEVTFLEGDFDVQGDQLSDIGNHSLYTGRQRDLETGLYDYRTRFYHAPLGRFTSQDWIRYGGGMNLYAYVGGMPTGFVDPWGFSIQFPEPAPLPPELGGPTPTPPIPPAEKPKPRPVPPSFSGRDIPHFLVPPPPEKPIYPPGAIVIGANDPDSFTVWVGLFGTFAGVGGFSGGGLRAGAAYATGEVVDTAAESALGVPVVTPGDLKDIGEAAKGLRRLTKKADDVQCPVIPVVCFVAGTPVHTRDGERPIEELKAGDEAWSYDAATETWCLQKVVKPLQHTYQGELVTIETSDGDQIIATGNHPFWVVEGADLANRPAAQHVPSRDQAVTNSGRWIDAHELRAGDQLLTHLGISLTIANLYSTEMVVQVYNLEVEGHHNYAVGQAGVLVHNRTDGNDGFGGGGGKPPKRQHTDDLPPNPRKPTQADPHAPDPEATGPHTVIGRRNNPKESPEPYRQGITYDENGNPLGRVDVTDHGTPWRHPWNPHWHPFDPGRPSPWNPGEGGFGPGGPLPWEL